MELLTLKKEKYRYSNSGTDENAGAWGRNDVRKLSEITVMSHLTARDY
jgi:hypothetical protein